MPASFDRGIGFGETLSWHRGEELLPIDHELRYDALGTFARADLLQPLVKVPFNAVCNPAEGFENAFDGMHHIVNQTTGQVVTAGTFVGDGYVILQNAQMAERVQPFLDTRKMAIEFAASLCNGGIVYIQCRVLGADIVVDEKSNDLVQKYWTFATGHDGRYRNQLIGSNIRTVCKNTYDASVMSGVSFCAKHTKNMNAKLDSIVAQIDEAIEQSQNETLLLQQMLATGISDRELRQYVKTVFGVADENDSDLSTRKKNQIEDCVRLAYVGQGQDGRLSYWSALNGVTEWINHRRVKDDAQRFFSANLDTGNKNSALFIARKAYKLAAQLTVSA